MKPIRKEPVIVVRPVKDADKAKAAMAALKSRQILSGTAALHRYIERLEALEAAGWTWK
jgi:hypothetical protein